MLGIAYFKALGAIGVAVPTPVLRDGSLGRASSGTWARLSHGYASGVRCAAPADSRSARNSSSVRRHALQIRNGTGMPAGPSITSTVDIGARGRWPQSSHALVAGSGKLRWLALGSSLWSSGTRCHATVWFTT